MLENTRVHACTHSLRSIYDLYCDYVQKNPFHEVDQVIKSDLFDQNLFATISAINKRLGASVT